MTVFLLIFLIYLEKYKMNNKFSGTGLVELLETTSPRTDADFNLLLNIDKNTDSAEGLLKNLQALKKKNLQRDEFIEKQGVFDDDGYLIELPCQYSEDGNHGRVVESISGLSFSCVECGFEMFK